MSAFILNQKHLNAIITWAIDRGMQIDAQKTLIALAQENLDSVNYRYDEEEELEEMEYRPVSEVLARRYQQEIAVAIIKMIGCWEYQSNEHDFDESSFPWQFMKTVKDKALQIAEDIFAPEEDENPIYDSAPWDWDDDNWKEFIQSLSPVKRYVFFNKATRTLEVSIPDRGKTILFDRVELKEPAVLEYNLYNSGLDCFKEHLAEFDNLSGLTFKVPSLVINKVDYEKVEISIFPLKHSFIASVWGLRCDRPAELSGSKLLSKQYQLSKAAESKIEQFFKDKFLPIIYKYQNELLELARKYLVLVYQDRINAEVYRLDGKKQILSNLLLTISEAGRQSPIEHI